MVHSVGQDFLKPDDLRYKLLQYINDPSAFAVKQEQIAAKADSPFEKEVAEKLASQGYNFVQQFEVGRYSIDIVVTCGDNRIAVECDGDRYHACAGEDKIRQDMNRQLVLERLGWKFVRIRGSQWYKDKEAAFQKLCERMAEHGIFPEPEPARPVAEGEKTELQKRVLEAAGRYLDQWKGKPDVLDITDIPAVPDSEPEAKRAEPEPPAQEPATALPDAAGSTSSRPKKRGRKKSSVSNAQDLQQLTFDEMGDGFALSGTDKKSGKRKKTPKNEGGKKETKRKGKKAAAEPLVVNFETAICHGKINVKGYGEYELYEAPERWAVKGLSVGKNGRPLSFKKEWCMYELDVEDVIALLSKGKTRQIDTFISRYGKPFSSRLIFDSESGWVKFDF